MYLTHMFEDWSYLIVHLATRTISPCNRFQWSRDRKICVLCILGRSFGFEYEPGVPDLGLPF